MSDMRDDNRRRGNASRSGRGQGSARSGSGSYLSGSSSRSRSGSAHQRRGYVPTRGGSGYDPYQGYSATGDPRRRGQGGADDSRYRGRGDEGDSRYRGTSPEGAASSYGSEPTSRQGAYPVRASGQGSSGYPRNGAGEGGRGGQYSRQGAARAAQQQRDRKRRRIAIIIVAVVAALALVGGGVAWAYMHNIESNLHKNVSDDLSSTLTEQTEEQVAAGDPFYMLLLGADNNTDRTAEGMNSRTDTIILARVDPQNKQVTLISIHRDTIVDIPGYGQDKINAAYAYGGQALIVQTVENFAGVDISHYAEVDMDGFLSVIDQLGGVEVNVPESFYDDYLDAGLDAGVQTLSSEQALLFCRARHAFDDLGDGDVYRANHQRLVLSAVAKKILSSDVATMVTTISTLSSSVTTDMSLDAIINLAKQMRGMDTEKGIYSAMNPTTSTYQNDTWYENSDTAAWKEMMTRVNQGLPPTAEESSSTDADVSATSCSIIVRNGSGIDGAGETAQSRLVAAGLKVSDVAAADTSDYEKTIVIYNKTSYATAAETIAKALGCGYAYYDSDGLYTLSGDILVVIGQDWK